MIPLFCRVTQTRLFTWNTVQPLTPAVASFLQPITYPDKVSIYHRLYARPDESSTSVLMECVILSHRHRRVAATTEEDVVVYDYGAGRKATVPEFARSLLGETWKRQEDEARRARARVWELTAQVEALEKETWDREDAVEDMGSAGGKGAKS